MVRKHSEDVLQSPASQGLREFLHTRGQAWQQGTPEFEQFEREVHEHIMSLERECLAQELARYDVEAERIEVQGVSYQSVLRSAETYLSAAGPVRVERHLYRPAGRNAKSLCPLEMRAGIINGYWTPRAARHGAFVVAQLPTSQAAALFAELGATIQLKAKTQATTTAEKINHPHRIGHLLFTFLMSNIAFSPGVMARSATDSTATLPYHALTEHRPATGIFHFRVHKAGKSQGFYAADLCITSLSPSIALATSLTV